VTLLRFVLTRLAWMVPTFLAMTVLTFAVAHLAPGDPLQLSESGEIDISPEDSSESGG
jgi:dipeptide transport system permease protein